MSNKVIVHCKPSILDSITDLDLEWDYSTKHGMDEVEVTVNDVAYLDGNYPGKNGVWEDRDTQLCEYYGIDHKQVIRVERMNKD